MSIPLATGVTIPPDILFQELDSEAVLLNLQTGRYYGLDDVGTCMWQLLAEHGDVATVVEQLLEEYDVDEGALRQDLADLIVRLAEAGLVTVVE